MIVLSFGDDWRDQRMPAISIVPSSAIG